MQAKIQPGEDIASIRQVLVLLDTGEAVAQSPEDNNQSGEE